MSSDLSSTLVSDLPLPRLTQAKAPLTCEIDAVNEFGERHVVSIPAERALTVYVDKRELVTLMTLGANPELLVLGYLRNQRLVGNISDIESITVDWEVGAAAVKTRDGIKDIEEKTSRRVVTTGCGQGSMFGGLMDEVDQIRLPFDASITQSQLYSVVNTIRLKETTYKSAGSVHACALFDTSTPDPAMLLFVEDVGRHNAIDTIAGWMWVNMAPTLVASRTALDVPAQDAQALRAVQTRAGGFGAAALSPEGALRLRPGEAGFAAPACEDEALTSADWQSQTRGPCLYGPGDARDYVPPEVSEDAWRGASSRSDVPALLPLPLGESGGAGAPAFGPQGLLFYTTGRLTSEMVIKSAQMGVPVVVSRSGITQMGHQVAQAVGLCAIGRATNRRFLCYANPQRLQLDPALSARPAAAPASA
jgi:FdhD protein